MGSRSGLPPIRSLPHPPYGHLWSISAALIIAILWFRYAFSFVQIVLSGCNIAILGTREWSTYTETSGVISRGPGTLKQLIEWIAFMEFSMVALTPSEFSSNAVSFHPSDESYSSLGPGWLNSECYSLRGWGRCEFPDYIMVVGRTMFHAVMAIMLEAHLVLRTPCEICLNLLQGRWLFRHAPHFTKYFMFSFQQIFC